MGSNSFPKEERLSGRKRISEVFAVGESGFAYPLRYLYTVKENSQASERSAGPQVVGAPAVSGLSAGLECPQAAAGSEGSANTQASGASADSVGSQASEASVNSQASECSTFPRVAEALVYPRASAVSGLSAGSECPQYPDVSGVSVLVSVSKRYHKRAVRRNLLKRRIREAFRTCGGPLREAAERRGVQIDIALLYSTKEVLDYTKIGDAVEKILARICERV